MRTFLLLVLVIAILTPHVVAAGDHRVLMVGSTVELRQAVAAWRVEVSSSAQEHDKTVYHTRSGYGSTVSSSHRVAGDSWGALLWGVCKDDSSKILVSYSWGFLTKDQARDIAFESFMAQGKYIVKSNWIYKNGKTRSAKRRR